MAKKHSKKPTQKVVVQDTATTPGAVEIKNTISIKWKLALLLGVISFVLYANTLPNGYVMDDGMVLINNKIVTQGIKAIPEILSTPRLKGIDNSIHPNDFYRPLSQVMFAIEYQLAGPTPAVSHFINILTFIGCVIMLFFFLDKLFERNHTVVAFIAAFLFAIHPIHTEVVANIKSRDELLCYFFGFWSLLLFMNFMKEGKKSQLLYGVLTLFLAYISKETVIAFLVIVPVLFFFYYNDKRERAVFITIGTVVATVVFLILRTIVLNMNHVNDAHVPVSFIDNALVNAPDIGSRIATEFLVLGYYIKLLFIPYPLLSNYSFNSIPFVSFGNPGALLSLAVYFGIGYIGISRFIKDHKDPWAFSILFFFATLFLFSNIPFLIGAEMGERFLFFASTGFCMAAALCVERLLLKTNTDSIMELKSAKVLAILIPLFLIFGGLTVARNIDWKSNYSLYKTDAEQSPNDAKLHYLIANQILVGIYPKETDSVKKHELAMESIDYIKKGLEIYPDDAGVPEFYFGHLGLARVFDQERLYDSAIYHDLIAIKLNPSFNQAYNEIANVFEHKGDFHNAIVYFDKYIDGGTSHVESTCLNIATCYKHMNSYDSAIFYYHKALIADPSLTDINKDIGNTFLDEQNYDSAEIYFKKILALKPDDPDGINGMGCIYFVRKNYPEAATEYKRSVALDPKNIKAYSNLGRTYFVMEQYQSAVDVLNSERRIAPNYAGDINFIALSYQKLGKQDSAKMYETMARKTDPGFHL